ncbi:DUF7097 family protein [Halovivax gelatinilyticus]|uniref:DUF7097 family protein n=1 Tax=Halovivax gelatinilyticus TaxID=2961597 RepID=UPI0020CA8978|nr:hypothetical protein [Halovivax gelatinilyticus]
MKKTPRGTAVGVDDPYEFVDRCDHLTDDGRCRLAIERPHRDPEFARDRASSSYRCHVVDPDQPPETGADSLEADSTLEWNRCPHFRCRVSDRECVRCGLEEHRDAHSSARPLLEEHHLSYAADDDSVGHEITVYLCRWCHAKTHNSWARLTDDVNPDPEALAAREERRSRELSELAFESAAERFDSDG